MGNCNYGMTKTNYFRVTDEEKFKNIMEHIDCEHGMELFINANNGIKTFAFGGYGSFYGYDNEKDESNNISLAIEKFQGILPEDEAMVIIDVIYQEFDYINGQVIVITSNNYKKVSLIEMENKYVKELLGKEEKNIP